jgi:hypothetical protein
MSLSCRRLHAAFPCSKTHSSNAFFQPFTTTGDGILEFDEFEKQVHQTKLRLAWEIVRRQPAYLPIFAAWMLPFLAAYLSQLGRLCIPK